MVKVLDSQSRGPMYQTKGDSVDPSKVDKMNTRNFWEFSRKSKPYPPSGFTSHYVIELCPWKGAIKFFSNPVYHQHSHVVLHSFIFSKKVFHWKLLDLVLPDT